MPSYSIGFCVADDEERLRQRVRLTLDRHLAFLHRLQQRSLRLRRCAVDLIGEEDVREHRPGPERERTLAVHHRPGEVRREHVGRELGTAERQPNGAGGRVREQRLRDARHAFEQHVPTDEERDEQAVDCLLVPEHDLGHLGLDAVAERDQSSLPALCSSAAARVPSAKRFGDLEPGAFISGDAQPIGGLERAGP